MSESDNTSVRAETSTVVKTQIGITRVDVSSPTASPDRVPRVFTSVERNQTAPMWADSTQRPFRWRDLTRCMIRPH